MSPPRRFRNKEGDAQEAATLANIYWRDGALVSAARCLDEAADRLREAQAIRNEAFGIPDPTTAPTVRVPADLIPMLAEFFDRTMGKMNIGASALDAQAIANWNACSLAVTKLKPKQEAPQT